MEKISNLLNGIQIEKSEIQQLISMQRQSFKFPPEITKLCLTEFEQQPHQLLDQSDVDYEQALFKLMTS